MDRYIITLAGQEWLDKTTVEDMDREGYKGTAVFMLYDALEESLTKELLERHMDSHRAKDYDKALKFLIRNKYIEEDSRTVYDIIKEVGRYDRDLGKLFKVYTDIGKQRLVRDKDVDEALMIALERIETAGVCHFPEAQEGLERALRSDREAYKIEALDRWVSLAHREGLLYEKDEFPTDKVNRDVGILLNRLANE